MLSNMLKLASLNALPMRIDIYIQFEERILPTIFILPHNDASAFEIRVVNFHVLLLFSGVEIIHTSGV